jgi:hypothetical protein
MPPSAIVMKQLAIEIFGDDSKLSASNKPKQSRSLKPPPVASSPSKLSPVSLQEVSNAGVNTLGSNNGKQPARVNFYNSAARISRPAGHSDSIINASLIEEQRKEAALHQLAEKTIVSQKQSNNPDRALESAESTIAMDIEQATDPVERLNRSIAEQQAQLAQLQNSLAALKASQEPPDKQDVQDMEEDEFIPVTTGHKHRKVRGMSKPEQQPGAVTLVPFIQQERDPLTELETKRPTYPMLPTPTPRRPFSQRVSWRIDIPKADTPASALIEGISEVWSVLKEADEMLIVYPWKAKNFAKFKALSGPSKLQNATKEFINRYFPDAYFRPQPGLMYLNVYIGGSVPYDELGKRTQYFFGTNSNRNRVGIWKNAIPFEDVVEIGWLFRSTPGMSSVQIQKELLAHTGIHASLRWRLIAIGVKGKLTEDLESRALHISVCREDCNLAKAKFTKLIFARHRRSHYIGGSPMRLIPLYKDVSPRNKIKCVYYAGRQQKFLKEILTAEIFDILQVDIQSGGYKVAHYENSF